MPVLANQRNDLYARHRAKGMIPSKAAQAAGYATGTSTTHLEQDAEIIARIAELMEEQQAHKEQQRAAAMEAARMVGQMTGITKGWVIQKLAENAQLAANEAMFKESNEALKLIGQEFGMFTGGDAGDENGNVPKTFDMDKLEAILDQSHGAIVPDEMTAIEKSKQFGEETAMRLIEGQMGNKRVDPKDREFSTGSETDVALTPEAVPDEDDYAIAREAEDFGALTDDAEEA